MLKKLVLGILVVAIAGAALAWLNRKSLILFIASNTGKVEVASNRVINWQQGPKTADMPAFKRPPNIVFILAGTSDTCAFPESALLTRFTRILTYPPGLYPGR